ncbi:toll-like receptor 2 [Condylostylus longicornis]|uniref:toll-like receptor 2 n=1 Tax=Condylostylus longicornis TaxID=2530218 RepID=UPI00244E2B1C|nr:toll-like receptor 2 [Condylostylus longicornis]
MNNNNDNSENGWIPKYLINKKSKLNINNVGVRYLQEKTSYSTDETSSVTENINCLMDNFKPEDYNWITFLNAGSELDLSNMSICEEEEILRTLKNLSHRLDGVKALKLAENNLTVVPYISLSLMKYTLKYLDLHGNNFFVNYNAMQNHNDNIYSMIGWARFPKMIDLEHLNLANCNIQYIVKNMFVNLTKLVVSFHHFNNNLKYLGLCLSSIQMLDNQIFSRESIEVLDLSGNPYVAINLNNNSFQGLENSLKVLWLSDSAIKKIFWLGKLKKLEYLNLSVNNINSLTNETFSTLRKLRYLDLSANHIGNWYYQIFKNNTALKILNIQENNINMITPEMYKDFKKMDFMALSKNNFVCKCYLRSLIDHADKNGNSNNKGEDFVNYLYKKVPSGAWDHLMNQVLIEQYYNQYIESLENLKNSTSIENFHSNDVNYEHEYTFQLLDYNEEDYWCFSGTKYFKLNDISHCKSKDITYEELNETAKILICGVVVFVAVSTIFAIGYFKKEKIKKIIHKIKKYFGFINGKNINYNSELNNNENYKYDVFVSYSDHDREWILEELIPNMDSDKELKICLHEREFKVGLTIWENIIFHMDKSRSLLLVISNSFLQSNWCKFEMQFAQKRLFDPQGNPLVLVLLEEIPNNIRPRALQHLMDLRTYIKWPATTGNFQKDNELKLMFWNRIKQSLKND